MSGLSTQDALIKGRQRYLLQINCNKYPSRRGRILLASGLLQ